MKILKLNDRVNEFLKGSDELLKVVRKDLFELGNKFEASEYEVTSDGNFMYVKHNEFEIQFYFEDETLKSKLIVKENYNPDNYSKIYVITAVVIKLNKYFDELEKEFEQYRKFRNLGRAAEMNMNSLMREIAEGINEIF
jgi:hypothetical protein